MRLFSYKNRPFHLGPYPLENLRRSPAPVDLAKIPDMAATSFARPNSPTSISNAMGDYQAMLDAIRDGLVKAEQGEVPSDLQERSNHLKSFGYYCDASQAGICEIPDLARLKTPISNPDMDRLADILKNTQTSTLASGVDVVMAELKNTMDAPPSRIDHHTHAIVYLYEFPRDPDVNEPGTDWIEDCQLQRAAIRASETAVVIANYIRLLGHQARAHSHSTSGVNLYKLAVAAGLGEISEDESGVFVTNPYVGRRFGIGAITTTLALSPDEPLAPRGILDQLHSHGPKWWLGKSIAKSAFNHIPYKNRLFKDGQYPFERSDRQDSPTTFIDERKSSPRSQTNRYVRPRPVW